MTERAFVIMQVGVKGSPERSRADEIFNFIVAPAVKDVGLEAYRADLDFTPGPITPKFLSELLKARLTIADLTGSNPNVFYELGIAHSFVRPLISIADSSKSLPFDTKDERVIELGEYLPTGLTHVQVLQAKSDLLESLTIVLTDNYEPPSPLRDLAVSASLDRLAPENPLASEMANIRESLAELRKMVSGYQVRYLSSHGEWTLRKPLLPTATGTFFTLPEIQSLLTTMPEATAEDLVKVLLAKQIIERSEQRLMTGEERSGNKDRLPSNGEAGSGDFPA